MAITTKTLVEHEIEATEKGVSRTREQLRGVEATRRAAMECVEGRRYSITHVQEMEGPSDREWGRLADASHDVAKVLTVLLRKGEERLEYLRKERAQVMVRRAEEARLKAEAAAQAAEEGYGTYQGEAPQQACATEDGYRIQVRR